jgi:L-fucose mutarotase/ribose pyranase (RbsD/FucU family)
MRKSTSPLLNAEVLHARRALRHGERARQAYCVIQTGERRFYGCFAFRKGVIPPEVA